MTSNGPTPTDEGAHGPAPTDAPKDEEKEAGAPGLRLYSSDDVVALTQRLPELMREAEARRRAVLAPTTETRRALFNVVLDFARERERKVFGGYALNAALTEVNKDDALYPDPTDPADVEFYSPDPATDIMELCDRLAAAGHVYVQGREAMHHSTYTVSVEFVRICDVTFLPRNVYDVVPFNPFQGLRVVDPQFLVIDYLRMVCDPFNSHWRLDKMFPRLATLQRRFPLKPPYPEAVEALASLRAAEIPEQARTWLGSRSATCALVGVVALSTFSKSKGESGKDGGPAYVTVVSVDYAADVASAAALFPDGAGARANCEFHPLADLLGACTMFTGPSLVLSIYDAAGKTVPVIQGGGVVPHGTKVASFPYQVFFALASEVGALATGEPQRAAVFRALAAELLTSRGAVDEGVFAEFAATHIGTPMSTMRVHMRNTDARLAAHGGPAWFTYDPSKKSKGDVAKPRFLEASGILAQAKAQVKASATEEEPGVRGAKGGPRRRGARVRARSMAPPLPGPLGPPGPK